MSNTWKIFVGVTSLVVMGCVAATPVRDAQHLSESTTIFFVRHAEAGEGDDPSLTEEGRSRALALVHVLEDVRLDAIHSTPLNRTLQTAAPIAEQRGLEVITTDPTQTFAEDMAATLRDEHRGQTVLVVSHSNTVPAMINALGGGPFEQLDHGEYDSLFVVTLLGEDVRVFRLQYGQKTPM